MPVKILGTDPADLEGELPALERLVQGSGHVFLVDSYAVTDAYLQALHRFGRVYLLDDMQQHAFPVDGVINYNLFASPEKYRELYGTHAGQYLGAAYVPVRQQFCEAAAQYILQDDVTDILITTGGGDKDNIAGEILRHCPEHSLAGCAVRYHLVVGRFNPNREKLEQYASVQNNVVLHCDVKDMAALMTACQLAVTAGGTTIYELSVLGVPLSAFLTQRTRKGLTEWLGAQQIAGYAGAWHRAAGETLERIGAWCLKAQKDPGLRRQCYETERGLIDGLGAAESHRY